LHEWNAFGPSIWALHSPEYPVLQQIANQLEFRQIKRRLEIGAIAWAANLDEEEEFSLAHMEAQQSSLDNSNKAYSTENGENGAETAVDQGDKVDVEGHKEHVRVGHHTIKLCVCVSVCVSLCVCVCVCVCVYS
jgi:hypothetical protein